MMMVRSMVKEDPKGNFERGRDKNPGPFTWSMCSKVFKKSMDFENLAVVLK